MVLRSMRSTTVPCLLAVILTGACGNKSETRSAAGQTDCPPAAGQTDTGSNDTAPRPPGGQWSDSVVDFNRGPTAETLGGTDAVAVLRVVSRAEAVAAAEAEEPNARPSAPHERPKAGSQFTVLRPARLAVVRQLKGSLPQCLDLDVPGGRAGMFTKTGSQFPAQLAPGDQLLGLIATQDEKGPTAPYATALFRADRDGWLTLPFGDRERVNVNTWEPEIREPQKPTPPPGKSFTPPQPVPPAPPSEPPPTRREAP